MALLFEDQCCEFCMFWKPMPPNGVCRRSNPIGNDHGNPAWSWPLVSAEEWCGEFKEKPPPRRTHV